MQLKTYVEIQEKVALDVVSTLQKFNNGFYFESNGWFYIGEGEEKFSLAEKDLCNQNNPLKILHDYMNQFKIEKSYKIPFVGGFLGVFSYELIRSFESLETTNEGKLTLPYVEGYIVKDLVAYHKKEKKLYFISTQQADENGKMQAKSTIQHLQRKINTRQMKKYKKPKLEAIESNISKERFIENVNKAKAYINAGDIFQVVLSQRFIFKTNLTGIELFSALYEEKISPYKFYLPFEEFNVIGFSPETLVAGDAEKIKTYPIAGTRKRGKNIYEDEKIKLDLIKDPKERAEHLMLVDLARNDIGRVSYPGSVEVKNFMNVTKYSNVFHLTTEVTGTPKAEWPSIIGNLSPAGTLSGAPKIRAMEIIDELETEKRELYGGSIGFISFDQTFDTCIHIRTVVEKEGVYYLQVGAGIVYDSIGEKEYKETVNKAKSIMSIFEEGNNDFID